MSIKHLLPILTLSISQSISAQYINDCGQPTTKATLVNFPFSLTTLPYPLGTGTTFSLESTRAPDGSLIGQTLWWYYPTQIGWGVVFFVGSAEILSTAYYKQLSDEIYIAASDTDKLTAIKNVISKRVTVPISDPSLTKIWCPTWNKISAGKPLPPISPDGSKTPPLLGVVDNTNIVWTIRADGFVLRNDIATNGHALIVKKKSDGIYVQSPNGLIWYKWLGNNTWARLTTIEP